MVDGRTPGSPEPPINQDDAENGTTGNKIYNRSIAHATMATVDNDCFANLCTLNIRTEKK